MTEQLLVFVDTVLAGLVSAEPTPTGRRLLFNYDASYLAAGDRTPTLPLSLEWTVCRRVLRGSASL